MYEIDTPNKSSCLLVNLNFSGVSLSDLTNDPIRKKVVLTTVPMDKKYRRKKILFRISINIIYFLLFKAEISFLLLVILF